MIFAGIIPSDNEENKSALSEIIRDLEITGFSMDEREGIWKVTAGVLSLGNISFEELEGNSFQVKKKDWLEKVCKLLDIDEKAFQKVLTYKIREINKQTIESPLSLQDCIFVRYFLLRFAFLVFFLSSYICSLTLLFIFIETR